MEFIVKFKNIDCLTNFARVVSKFDFDIDIISGRYVIDAKSIMSLFTLDITRDIKMNVILDSLDPRLSEFKKQIKEFLIIKGERKI